MFQIFISIFLFISLSHSLHEPLPCPDECLCKALNTPIDALTQTEYSIDCSATTLNKLVYNAPLRIGGADIPNDGESEDQDEDDGAQKDYLISLDLSNTAIKIFSNQTVKLTGFSHQIQALSLTSFNTNYLYWKYHTINVRKHLMEDEQPGIMIDPYAFNSSLLTNIKSLNLSYCCDEDENPFDTICPYLFKPLSKLETLDMSGSDMYKVCLNTPGSYSSTLHNLILRHNQYDVSMFPNEKIFSGVKYIDGLLDLQMSTFQMGDENRTNCIFDVFRFITELDLSKIRFRLKTDLENDVDNNDMILNYLTRLLKCRSTKITHNGQQLLVLRLQQLNLIELPINLNKTFPQLHTLDLSYNQIREIDIEYFINLKTFIIDYNPIDFNINFREPNKNYYDSISMISTTTTTKNMNKKDQYSFIEDQLEKLLQLTTNINYSSNLIKSSIYSNITMLVSNIDFDINGLILNIKDNSIYSIDFENINKLNELHQLNINGNNFNEINLLRQTKLIYLDCSKQLNRSLKRLILNLDLYELEYLSCTHNQLINIEQFDINKQHKLKYLDLSYNKFNNSFLIPFLTNIRSKNIQIIRLTSNYLTKLTTNMFNNHLVNLYELNLSNNLIETIESLAIQSPNLEILDLTGNPLQIIAMDALLPKINLLFISQDLLKQQKHCSSNIMKFYSFWYKNNGTYIQKSLLYNPLSIMNKKDQNKFILCQKQYIRGRSKWLNRTRSYSGIALFIALFAFLIGIILGSIILYKQKYSHNRRKYRLLNNDKIIDLNENNHNNNHNGNRSDDEEEQIVMSLTDPPFFSDNRNVKPTSV